MLPERIHYLGCGQRRGLVAITSLMSFQKGPPWILVLLTWNMGIIIGP